MAPSLLRRLLGRAGSAENGSAAGESFSLPGSMRPGARLLLLASDDLTDLLFAMPLVRGLRATVPDLHVGLLCDERTSHVALSSDVFADVMVVDTAQIAAGSPARRAVQEALAADAWDVAILLGRHADPDRDELAFLSGATLRMGPDHPGAFPNLNCQVRPPRTPGYPYARAHLWGRLLGVSVEDVPLHWPLDPKRHRQMNQLVHFNKPRKQQRLIGFDPGTARSGTRLGARNVALLANHIVRTVDSRAMILTSDPDPAVVEDLRAALDNAPLELPRPTLLETVLLVHECDLFVTGNTDLMHYAAALEVPVLALFPPQESDEWIPSRASRCEVVRVAPGETLDLADLMTRVERLLS